MNKRPSAAVYKPFPTFGLLGPYDTEEKVKPPRVYAPDVMETWRDKAEKYLKEEKANEDRENMMKIEMERAKRAFERNVQKYGYKAATAIQKSRQEARNFIESRKKPQQNKARLEGNSLRVPLPNTDAFQTYMYNMLDARPTELPSFIPLTSRFDKQNKSVHEYLRDVSRKDAENQCGTRLGKNSSMQPHQIVVYAMAALRGLDAIRTPGLLALHSTGAGKTLIGLSALVAFWNKTVPGTDKRVPIFMVSTKGNQEGNSLMKLARLGMVFFDKFADVHTGDRPFDLSASEEGRILVADAKARGSFPADDSECQRHVALKIRKRLMMGLNTIVRSNSMRDLGKKSRDDLYTFTKLANDWPTLIKSQAGLVEHAVFIIDEIQFLLKPPPNEQIMEAKYRSLRRVLINQRDPKTTWVLGMTATPGETQEDAREIMSAVAADPEFRLEKNRMMGLVSFANLNGDFSHFPQLDVHMECLPVFSESRYGLLYQQRVKAAYAAMEKDQNKSKFYVRIREFGNFLEVPADELVDEDETNADSVNSEEDDIPQKYSVHTRDGRGNFVILPSPKLVRLVENIKRLRGKHYVFTSSPRTLLLIAALLEKHAGLAYLPCKRGGPCVMKDEEKYFVILDNVSSTKSHSKRYAEEKTHGTIEELKRLANAKDNASGSRIKVILATRENFKGVDMNHLRYIHLVEPFFDYQQFVQLKGRGPRYCSHVSAERKVDMILYQTVMNDARERCKEFSTADCVLWNQSRKNYEENWLKLEDMLQKSSVDYLVFRDTLHKNIADFESKMKELVCSDDPTIQERKRKYTRRIQANTLRTTRLAKLDATRKNRIARQKQRLGTTSKNKTREAVKP